MNLTQALQSLRPDCQFNITNEDYDTIVYNDDLPIPTIEELQVESDRLEDEYNSLQYARNRKEAYLKLNQDELRYDDLVNGTSTWTDAIEAIKLEFPKEV